MSPFPNNWPPALSRNPELIQEVGEGKMGEVIEVLEAEEKESPG